MHATAWDFGNGSEGACDMDRTVGSSLGGTNYTARNNPRRETTSSLGLDPRTLNMAVE